MATRERLSPDVFRLPVERIREGYYSDNYFNLTKELLEEDDRRLWILAARPELCVFLFDADPGYVGPSTHVHRQHVDAFYVLEGALAFELDGEPVDAPAGTWVAATPGCAHTFRNAREERVRFLNVHAPGLRFDEYLRRQAGGEDGRPFHESFAVYEMEVA